MRIACNEISDKREAKALKDVIGFAYENHRRRLYKFFGLRITKKDIYTTWNPDITAHSDTIYIIEEDKAHYIDSCFMGRAILNIAMTISNYLEQGKESPYFVLHSFTRYNGFEKKFLEMSRIINPIIVKIMETNFSYTYICTQDRLPKKKWFQVQKYAYLQNMSLTKIKQDIQFFKTMSNKIDY